MNKIKIFGTVYLAAEIPMPQDEVIFGIFERWDLFVTGKEAPVARLTRWSDGMNVLSVHAVGGVDVVVSVPDIKII